MLAGSRCRPPSRRPGICWEAAGAIEAIFSILAIRDSVVPPTLNLDSPSRVSAIDRVAKQAQERRVDVALSNSFGFGGTNASILFRRAA